jgi:catechol 2,3-dioxygenase-like lactoylglutathione lyase family enzyme
MEPLALLEVTLDCPEPRDLAEFYRGLLGWPYAPGHDEVDPAGDEWLVLLPPSGGTRLAFQRSAAAVPAWGQAARIHVDIAVPDLAAAHDPFRVYADPAGHPFCATEIH